MILLLIDDVNIVVCTVKDKLEIEEQKNKAEVEAAKKKVAVAEKKVKEEEVSVAATKDEVKNQKVKKLKRIRRRMTRRVSR
ncbi:putative protein isoform X1 [Capsicum annuum]|nr:uncharacterized protein LOC107863487 isoform X3 [Capsicum annuum]